MRAHADFRTILDQKLGEAAFVCASPSAAGTSSSWQPSARPVFLFGDFGRFGVPWPVRQAASARASAWTAVYAARPGARRATTRALTPAQRQALKHLQGLGCASLGADFTGAEIKSAFRALARQYHPDRHPGSDPAERARLASTFAGVCDAYRTLTTAIH
jgi:hypothetical protein